MSKIVTLEDLRDHYCRKGSDQIVVDIATFGSSEEENVCIKQELKRVFGVKSGIFDEPTIFKKLFLIIDQWDSDIESFSCHLRGTLPWGSSIYNRNHIPYILLDNDFNVVKMFEPHPEKYTKSDFSIDIIPMTDSDGKVFTIRAIAT